MSKVNAGGKVTNAGWNGKKLDPESIQVCARVPPNEMQGIGTNECTDLLQTHQTLGRTYIHLSAKLNWSWNEI